MRGLDLQGRERMKSFIELKILDIDSLKEHEGVEEERLDALTSEIKIDGVLKKAIAVDAETLLIIDGHHRIHALKRLGCKKVPACLFDYSSSEIAVLSWRNNPGFRKDHLIASALSGKKLPPRSTRHIVKLEDGEESHISNFEKDVFIPLKELQ